jgi:hypothetical protein
MQAATGNTATTTQAVINDLTRTINQGYDNWLSRTKVLEQEFSNFNAKLAGTFGQTQNGHQKSKC